MTAEEIDTALKKRSMVRCKKAPPKKLKNQTVRSYFQVVELPSGKIQVICLNCVDPVTKKHLFQRIWERENVTRMRDHLINQCPMTDVDTRDRLFR